MIDLLKNKYWNCIEYSKAEAASEIWLEVYVCEITFYIRNVNNSHMIRWEKYLAKGR